VVSLFATRILGKKHISDKKKKVADRAKKAKVNYLGFFVFKRKIHYSLMLCKTNSM